MKPKLLLHPEKATAFFLEPLFDEHFDRVFIDESKTYDPKECIVFCHSMGDKDWVLPWRDRGFKVAIDNTWENDRDVKSIEGTHMIQSGPWFFRANESLWYKALGYDRYQRQPDISKEFLMLMNKAYDFRDMIFDRIDLSNSLYSYHDRGIKLNHSDINPEDGRWQRHFNTDWYNITKYSLVVESTMIQENLCHTEKTWKPIAFQHPFVIWGSTNLLQSLREQGFMTLDHVIDESYDLEEDHKKRLKMILDQVGTLRNIELSDDETVRRTKHNHALFYDIEWSQRQFRQNFFLPLLELLG